jgi:C-terminal processing protease CtpA/Prc
LANFDIFWTTFEEHYPFFAMHGIDWRTVRDTYRPKITDRTTAEELFGVFKSMIEPLHDSHVFLHGTSIKQRFQDRRQGTKLIDDAAQRKIRELIETHYTHAKLKTWCNDRVRFGVLPGSVGYLCITALDTDAIVNALDHVFQDAKALRGLVIDVRVNRGGSDVRGVAVASRLAPEEYLAFAKKARIPGERMQFTALQETLVHKSDRPHFDGKVVLLQGSNTISAGETFIMALMGRTPRVIRVGENTQGVFSDILQRSLPNGFRFGLPNEIFLTADGKSFDGTGIPPDVSVPVFPKEDLTSGRDGCLDKALEILSRQ